MDEGADDDGFGDGRGGGGPGPDGYFVGYVDRDAGVGGDCDGGAAPAAGGEGYGWDGGFWHFLGGGVEESGGWVDGWGLLAGWREEAWGLEEEGWME